MSKIFEPETVNNIPDQRCGQTIWEVEHYFFHHFAAIIIYSNPGGKLPESWTLCFSSCYCCLQVQIPVSIWDLETFVVPAALWPAVLTCFIVLELFKTAL